MKRTLQSLILSSSFVSAMILGFVVIALPALATHETYTPYGGESDVNRESSYNRMVWDSRSSFTSTSTYEHETIIYSSKFAKPASGGYWASDLPLAYKDTRAFDWTDNFAVGSSSAINIVRYWWYYTYYDLSPEDQSTTTSRVRINGQKGHRSPSWCYSNAWCVYPDATYGLVEFTAPAGLSWTRK